MVERATPMSEAQIISLEDAAAFGPGETSTPRGRPAAALGEPLWVRCLLIGTGLAFLGVFLLVPLVAVFAQALAKGWTLYFRSLSDADALAAIRLTFLTAAVCVPSTAVFGVAAASGALLWRIPLATSYDQNIVTPIVRGDVLIYSGLGNPTIAVRLVRSGETWRPEPVWENPDVSFYMSTPVVAGGRIYGLRDRNKGQFVGLDAATGRLLWETRGREGDNAAIVDLGSALVWLTSGAELVVSEKAADAFSELRRYTVADSPTWAHPVPTAAGILIKDERSLALWRAQPGGPGL